MRLLGFAEPKNYRHQFGIAYFLRRNRHKWNKIEHRFFSFISQNWRGKPLLSFEVIVNLIAATTTVKGLKVHAEVDDGVYPAGTKIADKELAGVRLRRDKFHGDWNYEILPHMPSSG